MSLVFGAVVPHPPMLLPSIGKDAHAALKKTVESIKQVEEELYAAKPQIIVVLSPHTSLFGEAFVLNAHPVIQSNFAEFGDLNTTKTWKTAPELAARISHAAKKAHLPVQLVSQECVDHGVSIPLSYLTEHLDDIQILPIGFSERSMDDHVAFGHFLKDIFVADTKRIAVIASVDLSHRVDQEKSRQGYHPSGVLFDQTVIQALEKNDVSLLTTLTSEFLTDASTCSHRSLVLFLSIFAQVGQSFHLLSYEHPFGVGYATGTLSL